MAEGRKNESSPENEIKQNQDRPAFDPSGLVQQNRRCLGTQELTSSHIQSLDLELWKNPLCCDIKQGHKQCERDIQDRSPTPFSVLSHDQDLGNVPDQGIRSSMKDNWLLNSWLEGGHNVNQDWKDQNTIENVNRVTKPPSKTTTKKPPSVYKLCRYGDKCFKTDCRFGHPTKEPKFISQEQVKMEAKAAQKKDKNVDDPDCKQMSVGLKTKEI